MVKPNLKNLPLRVKISLLVLVLVGLSLPLYQARAFLGPLAGLIAAKVFAFALQLVLTITWAILLLANALLVWVISPSFISLPYTSGGVVDIGWPITRDLANMGFVFALLVIGVATALRYPRDEGYKIKKALPTLIGIILLVNFTPVIAGVIIDAANIIMMFFLEEISGLQAIMTPFGNQFSSTVSAFTNLQGALTEQINLVAKTVVLIMFNLMTALFMFLFTLLFLARYIAIWMLVILSPLAFFAYVLPATRKYFTAWWSQFLQWAFVGVTAAFFLYLTEQLLVVMSTTPFIAPPVSPTGLSLTDVFNNILPYAIVEAFLVFGFFASLSSGAMGAGAVISTGRQWSSAATKWSSAATKSVGGWAGKTGESWGRAALEKTRLGKGAMSIANRMALTKTPFAGSTSFGGKLANAALNPFAGAIRAAGRQGPQALNNAQAKIAAKELEVKKMTVDEAASNFLGTNDLTDQIGILSGMIKEGKWSDFKDSLKKSGMSDPQIDAKFRSILGQANKAYSQIDGDKELLSVMPDSPEAKVIFEKKAAEKVAKNLSIPVSAVTPAQIAAELPNQYDSFFKKMKPERVANINPDVYTPGKYAPANAAIAESIAKNWSGSQMEKAIDVHGSQAIDGMREQLKLMAGAMNHLDSLRANNSRMADYILKNHTAFKMNLKGVPMGTMTTVPNPTPPPPTLTVPDPNCNPNYGMFI